VCSHAAKAHSDDAVVQVRVLGALWSLSFEATNVLEMMQEKLLDYIKEVFKKFQSVDDPEHQPLAMDVLRCGSGLFSNLVQGLQLMVSAFFSTKKRSRKNCIQKNILGVVQISNLDFCLKIVNILLLLLLLSCHQELVKDMGFIPLIASMVLMAHAPAVQVSQWLG
jgi:hypothetical protein